VPYFPKDVASKTTGEVSFMRWGGLIAKEPGVYDVCHCMGSCEDPALDGWQSVGELMVEGLKDGFVWNVTEGRLFDFEVTGWGLPPSVNNASSVCMQGIHSYLALMQLMGVYEWVYRCNLRLV
jgi:hypothetical protein